MQDKQQESKRLFLQQTLATTLFVTATSSGLLTPAALASPLGKVPKKLEPGKSIYDLRGEVFVDGKKATEDTFISANSLVTTGSNSYVVFVIGSDAHILRENSRVQFSGQSVFEEALNLVTGKLLSVFGKRQGNQSHTIETSTATIGIRGTGVYAESEKDVSYVCTCYGAVELQAAADSQSRENIQSAHHDAPRYIYADGKAGKLIEPAPVINHTDEELLLIETLVGRTTPFSSVQQYSAPRRGY